MSDALKDGQAVCGFCMKVYEAGQGEQCGLCGDIGCARCFADMVCPDCEGELHSIGVDDEDLE
jgi:hypothetical protein